MLALEIFFWLVFLIPVGAGSVLRTVAASVFHLSSLQVVRAERVARARNVGDAILALGMIGGVALAVDIGARVGGNASVNAAGAVGIALVVQALARAYARHHLERLATPLLGDAVAFLPLFEAREDLPEAQAREEAIEQMVEASEKVGLIEADEHEMISGILQLDRTLTREIMVPRIDVVAMDADTSLRDALAVVIAGAHSRVPIYEESIDHIIGVLYAKDLLKTLRDGTNDVTLRSLLRPAYFVPESKPLDELLQELQSNKVHMAIVVDEYGGTAGIVTIEDVLEEIVGEIQDEYDTSEEPLIERVSETEAIFNARVNVDEVNEMFELHLPTESDTLGGLVYQRLEKMPKVGDQVRVDDVTLEVLSIIGRRIKKVRVVKAVDSETVGQ